MKTQRCLLYLGPKYVKTEEIAERKGVIFLHLKELVSVCVWGCACTTLLRRVGKSKRACMHEKHMEGKWEREGRKRNWPLICWSQLITFSRPDGRHSSNLWPQPLGPTVLTPQQSTVRDKQSLVYAGHRNRWAWGVRLVTERLKLFSNSLETQEFRFDPDFFLTNIKKGKTIPLRFPFCFDGCEKRTTSAPQKVKHHIYSLL